MPHLIECIAAIALLLLIIYFLKFRPKHKEQKKAILQKFREVRKKSLSVQNAFINYIMEQDTAKKIFADDQTYNQFLNQLKKDHIYNLSEKKYVKLKNTNNMLILKKISNMIDDRDAKLDEIQKKFEASKK